MTTCRSCQAPIEWVESKTTGKSLPLDVAPHAKGNLAVVNGKSHAYTTEDARLGRDRRQSHFVTCPDADDWRGR